MSCVATCISTYDKEIRQIYGVPLIPHEVNDFFAAYSECAMQHPVRRARRAPRKRVPRNCNYVLDDQPEYNLHAYIEVEPRVSMEPFRVSPNWDQVRYEPAGFSCGRSHPVHIRGPYWSYNSIGTVYAAALGGPMAELLDLAHLIGSQTTLVLLNYLSCWTL